MKTAKSIKCDTRNKLIWNSKNIVSRFWKLLAPLIDECLVDDWEPNILIKVEEVFDRFMLILYNAEFVT